MRDVDVKLSTVDDASNHANAAAASAAAATATATAASANAAAVITSAADACISFRL